MLWGYGWCDHAFKGNATAQDSIGRVPHLGPPGWWETMFRSLLDRFLHKIAYVAPGGWTVRPWLHRLRGVKIGKRVWISQFVYIDEVHPEAVTIQDNCTIGLRTSIFAHFYWGARKLASAGGQVVIEQDTFVGPHCLILPGVRIGRGAVIKAGSVVTRDVPAHAFWGPAPSGALGEATVPLTPDHSYEAFLKGLRPTRRRGGPRPTSTDDQKGTPPG